MLKRLEFIKRNSWYTELILVLVICSIPLCIGLSNKSIEVWDESRNACNALAMYQNHNFVVRYFNGSPDMWEVKPPLLIWTQVLSFKLFGISELSLRIPILTAILFLLLFIIYFFRKEFNLIFVGCFACLILASSNGVIDRHIGRTGDHEGVLLLWLMLAFFYFYRYTQTMKGRYLLIVCLFLILSVLTKSIISLMFLPGFFIFALYKRLLRNIIKSPYFYVGIGAFVVVAAVYYYLREKYSPGYLHEVWKEEIARYVNKEPGHRTAEFWYYWNNFLDFRFIPWIYFLPLSIPGYFLIKNKKLKDFLVFTFICCISIFLIISKGCKNLWYDAPLYPLMAIMISLGFWGIFDFFLRKRLSKVTYKVVFYLIVVAVSFIPYKKCVARSIDDVAYHKTLNEYSIPYYLKEHVTINTMPENLSIGYTGYNAHILYYTELFRYKYNKKLEIVSPYQLKQNDITIICEQGVKDSVQKIYNYEKVDSFLFSKIIRIIDRKQ